MIGFVGGEPLMHPHWREVFEAVDKRKCHTVVFTNGWFLEQAATDLAAAGIGGIYVSIDASQAQDHDRKRGLSGLFDKAMAGIAAAKKEDLTVGLSCCVTKEDFESGELDRIIELGRQQGVHEVLIFDAIPVGRYCSREDLWDHQAWVDQMTHHVQTTYNQDKNYPGVLVYAYFTSHMSLGCDAATCYCYVSPYGEVCPCDFYHKKFGNIREEKLYKIWDKMTRTLGAQGSNWTGCWAKQRQVVHPETVKEEPQSKSDLAHPFPG
jgi:MoaA/NifB/PqqE/SkfB family radical SAM enzyme